MEFPAKNFVVVTPESAKALLEKRKELWSNRLSSARPAGFSLPAELEVLRSATGYQKQLLDDLRKVADEITDGHWLRVFAHNPRLTAKMRGLTDAQIPSYLPPEDFARAGMFAMDSKQELWQRDVGDNMPALALAALLWQEDKYIHALKNHVLAACDYPSWGQGVGVENRDLSCAHLGRGIAVARDWLPEIWTREELDLIRSTIEKRVSETLRGLYGASYWHNKWMDNHCHCSLASLAICGLVFFDEIEAAPEWLAASELGLELVMRYCHPDGSSYEGLPYWSYGTSFLLQAIEVTRRVSGFDRFYDSPYLRHSFSYRLHSSTPPLGATLPFGDAIEHDYYGPSFLLNALARQYRDGHAQWLAQQIPFPPSGGADGEVWNLLWHDPTLVAERPTLDLDFHIRYWDVAVTRSGWEIDDYVLAIKSGFTNRNHSHLDAGSLAFAWGDQWLITLPGYGEVGPGFWEAQGRRWQYYSNSTESHTTLIINGQMQRFSEDARGTIVAFEITPQTTRTVIDLTDAYEGVRRLQREVIHRRGVEILVFDEIELDTRGYAEWLLQPGGDVAVTQGVVHASGVLGSLEIQMLWPEKPFEPRQPTRPMLDVPLETIKTHCVRQDGQKMRFVCRIALHPTRIKQ
ncbi:hypothetical protein IAD21_06356 [Abditibacteriota bacterium]|nr:hypothetical protein IAD21_06356 [Abditibacteriota bacterium]